MTVKYLQDIANEAKIKNDFIYVDEIGIIESYLDTPFVTRQESPINNIFKLYPYEWLFNEKFGKQLIDKKDMTLWIEPPYKAIMSNKMLLVYLHKLFPDHPNILPAFYGSAAGIGNNYVKKPVYGREGHNIQIVKGGQITEHSDGDYGEEGFVYQQYFELPVNDGMSPVIGSWMIGGVAAGMGIKETPTLIHGNMSKFVPHYFIQKV